MAKKTGVNPRKHPAQNRSKSTVETILTAAAQVLESVGFDSATTNRIAERAGVSIGSLYQYFPNKESLANALTEQFVKKHAERLENFLKVSRGCPPNEMIDSVITEVVSMYLNNLKILRIVARLLPRINAIPCVVETRRTVVASIARELQARSDEIDCPDPEMAAFLIVNSIMGVIQIILYDTEKEINKEALSKGLVRMAQLYLNPARE